MHYLMNHFPKLKPGDVIDLIAPASRCSDERLQAIVTVIESWGLRCRIPNPLFGNDILCANTDDIRFEQLKFALFNAESKAILCVRGGYGSQRLIPKLETLQPPNHSKLFIGMSDITALHLFFQQQWGWSGLHAGIAPDYFSKESLAALYSILFQEKKSMVFSGKALNGAATENKIIYSSFSGGNLSLLQASMGTSWALRSKNKIILIEEINERAYRVDRMLNHLVQANGLAGADAIVFADFLGGDEPDGSNLIHEILMRFANECPIPVIQIQGVGHGATNFPMPLGTASELQLGERIELRCGIE